MVNRYAFFHPKHGKCKPGRPKLMFHQYIASDNQPGIPTNARRDSKHDTRPEGLEKARDSPTALQLADDDDYDVSENICLDRFSLHSRRSRGILCVFRCFNARKLGRERTEQNGERGKGEMRGEKVSSLPLPPPTPSSVSFTFVPIFARSKSKNSHKIPTETLVSQTRIAYL